MSALTCLIPRPIFPDLVMLSGNEAKSPAEVMGVGKSEAKHVSRDLGLAQDNEYGKMTSA